MTAPNPGDLSPVFNHPAQESMVCPKCGRVVERGFTVQDGSVTRQIRGHVAGDPRTCVPLPTVAGAQRDARARKARRRGQ